MLALIAGLALFHDPLHVQGNRLMEDGVDVHLRGAVAPGLESSEEGKNLYRTCRVLLEDWHANCVELPISQDRWLGKVAGQKNRGDDYKHEVDDIVNLLSRRKQYLIIQLAWSDAGAWGKNLAPHSAPDQNSLDFWKNLAHRYKGVEHVMFHLYGPSNVPLDIWQNGGDVEEGAFHYKSPGLQKLMAGIRSVGAKNVILVSPTDVLSPGAPSLSDSLGYCTVISVGPAHSGPDQCIVQDVSASAPLTPGISNWIAETMLPGVDSSLISDWAYTPTPWGQSVKDAMAR